MSGYVRRSLDEFPKQGARAPWRLKQNYFVDIVNLRVKPVADESLRFERARKEAREPVAA